MRACDGPGGSWSFPSITCVICAIIPIAKEATEALRNPRWSGSFCPKCRFITDLSSLLSQANVCRLRLTVPPENPVPEPSENKAERREQVSHLGGEVLTNSHLFVVAVLCCAACGISVARPEFEPVSPAVKHSLTHWAAREVPPLFVPFYLNPLPLSSSIQAVHRACTSAAVWWKAPHPPSSQKSGCSAWPAGWPQDPAVASRWMPAVCCLAALQALALVTGAVAGTGFFWKSPDQLTQRAYCELWRGLSLSLWLEPEALGVGVLPGEEWPQGGSGKGTRLQGGGAEQAFLCQLLCKC